MEILESLPSDLTIDDFKNIIQNYDHEISRFQDMEMSFTRNHNQKKALYVKMLVANAKNQKAVAQKLYNDFVRKQ